MPLYATFSTNVLDQENCPRPSPDCNSDRQKAVSLARFHNSNRNSHPPPRMRAPLDWLSACHLDLPVGSLRLYRAGVAQHKAVGAVLHKVVLERRLRVTGALRLKVAGEQLRRGVGVARLKPVGVQRLKVAGVQLWRLSHLVRFQVPGIRGWRRAHRDYRHLGTRLAVGWNPPVLLGAMRFYQAGLKQVYQASSN